MIELRTQMMVILKSYHDRVYYQRAPETAKFPYVVYNFPNSFLDGKQEIFNLDVDIWDNKDNTIPLETLASNLWRGLDDVKYLDDEIQFSIYRENRLPPIDEDDNNIKRRKLIFQLRYFDRQL